MEKTAYRDYICIRDLSDRLNMLRLSRVLAPYAPDFENDTDAIRFLGKKYEKTLKCFYIPTSKLTGPLGD